MINPDKLSARMLERLAQHVIATLPKPPPWWAFWRKDPLNPNVRIVWDQILKHAQSRLTPYTLDAVAYDVVRDCAEYGPWNEEDVADAPVRDLLG